MTSHCANRVLGNEHVMCLAQKKKTKTKFLCAVSYLKHLLLLREKNYFSSSEMLANFHVRSSYGFVGLILSPIHFVLLLLLN